MKKFGVWLVAIALVVVASVAIYETSMSYVNYSVVFKDHLANSTCLDATTQALTSSTPANVQTGCFRVDSCAVSVYSVAADGSATSVVAIPTCVPRDQTLYRGQVTVGMSSEVGSASTVPATSTVSIQVVGAGSYY